MHDIYFEDGTCIVWVKLTTDSNYDFDDELDIETVNPILSGHWLQNEMGNYGLPLILDLFGHGAFPEFMKEYGLWIDVPFQVWFDTPTGVTIHHHDQPPEYDVVFAWEILQKKEPFMFEIYATLGYLFAQTPNL